MSVRKIAAFGTDIVGIERFLRLIQSLLQLHESNPLLLPSFLSLILLPFLSLLPIPQVPDLASVLPSTHKLGDARAQLNLSRKFIRTFRFLDSFVEGYSLMTTDPNTSPSQTFLKSLRITQKSLLGIYGLLESLTLPNVLFFSVFGEPMLRTLNFEAQRFWFFALVVGILVNIVLLLEEFAYAPVPESFAPLPTEKETRDKSGNSKAINGQSEKDKEQRRQADKEARQQRKRTLYRRIVSDTLDLFLPGAVMGLTPSGLGTVGLAMLGSTILSSVDVWNRV